MSLQIEEGCFYRTRTDEIVGPMTWKAASIWPWEEVGNELNSACWRDDGSYSVRQNNAHKRDLIEKVELASTTASFPLPVAPVNTMETTIVTGSNNSLTTDPAASLMSTKGDLPDTNPKTRMGAAKPSTFAIPPAAHIHLGTAMANGAAKYGLMNWREHAVSASVYFNAIDRHLRAWQDGENTARDSGVHHLAHVMACCAIVLDAMECGKLNDDRPLPGTAGDIIDRLTMNCVA